MGNKASSSRRRKSFDLYTAPNGDCITILSACNKVHPSCEHHVNTKGVDDDDFEIDIMSGLDIYRWFNDRNCVVPKHFAYCKQLAKDNPIPKSVKRPSHPTLAVNQSSSNSSKSVESDSSDLEPEPQPSSFNVKEYVE